MDLKEAVQARVDIVELIGQYTALALAGREWRGRCPFHQEKTASFYVNAEKGLYHCHGCKAGGTLFDFVMAVENLEFRDALEWLARRYNVSVPSEQRGRGFASGEKQRLYELNEAAAAFYREQLRGHAGEIARKYLEGRGVDSATAAQFDLGYAPREWTALTDHLLGSGARAADAVKLSLIRERDGGMGAIARDGQTTKHTTGGGARATGHYDYLRHRLVFPIRDVTGRVIGFAGRALSDEDQPKYLNVAATPLYDKGRTLYNLDSAKGRIRDEGAVLVEGYMDVIGLAQAGVQNAVACCGTALTEAHVLLLQRYLPKNVYILFDNDEAGRRAEWVSYVLLVKHGYSAGSMQLPDGQDPDEYVRKEGLDAWLRTAEQAKPVIVKWLEHQLANSPKRNELGQRRELASKLRPLFDSIPEELMRVEFIQSIAGALQFDYATVSQVLSSRVTDGSASTSGRPRNPKTAIRSQAYSRALAEGALPIEREVVRRLLSDPEFLFVYKELATAEWFDHPTLRAIFEELKAGAEVEALTGDRRFSSLVSELLHSDQNDPARQFQDNEELLVRHNNLYLERELRRLSAELRAAQDEGDGERERELLVASQSLKAQIR